MNLKKASQQQEKKVAEELNATIVVASGAKWGSKGDVRSDKYLVECKMTQKPFYSLTKSVWEKIHKEAIKDGLRIPMMCVDVEGSKHQFIVMLYTDVPEEIKEQYKDKYVRTVRMEQIFDRKSFQVRNYDTEFYIVNTTWGNFAVFTRHNFSEYFTDKGE